MQVEGKTAVIIGGARGLGKAFAQALLEKGANVMIGDVLEGVGRETEKELSAQHGDNRVTFQTCDVTKQDDVKALFAAAITKWRYVDIFSPVAGIVCESQWEKTIAVNLNGSILSTFVAMSHMAKDQGGQGGVIVLISSSAGFTQCPSVPVYAATKHGLVGFMRAYADDKHFCNNGISMCCLCPFAVDTDMMKEVTRPGRCLLLDDLKKAMDGDNVLISPKSVAEAFIQCVEDPAMRGQALALSKIDGKDAKTIVQFPSLIP